MVMNNEFRELAEIELDAVNGGEGSCTRWSQPGGTMYECKRTINDKTKVTYTFIPK
jgi:hypothetical protein